MGIGCSSDDGCEGNQSSLPMAGFYSSQTKSQISIDSLTVYGIGMIGDTTILDTATVVSEVYMPLNVDDSVSRFVFRYDQQALAAFNLTDTISLTYTSRPYFHSAECGAMYVYDITGFSYSQNLIDSVEVPFTHIDNTDREYVKIYFRTQEEGDTL